MIRVRVVYVGIKYALVTIATIAAIITAIAPNFFDFMGFVTLSQMGDSKQDHSL